MASVTTRPPSQLLGPEHDTDQPVDTTTTYLICTTPRSGSNLLCDRLTATGVLGTPTEYLELNVAGSYLATRWEVDNLFDYLEVLKTRRTGSNGVFGNKIHWRQLSVIAKMVWSLDEAPSIESCAGALDLLFPDVAFVHLRREDRVAQTVSLFKAFGTGAWSSYFEQRRALPDYDFESLVSHYRALVWEEISWETFFQATDTDPLRLTYSDVVDEPHRVVRSVASHLGLDVAIEDLPAPTLRQQRTTWNDDVRARFEDDLVAHGANPQDPNSILALPLATPAR